MGLLLPSAPVRAASRVSVRVEFYYGAAVAGGVGFLVWFSGGWEAYLAGRGPATALLEVSGSGFRAGIPLPEPWVRPDAPPGTPPRGIGADLVRIRF